MATGVTEKGHASSPAAGAAPSITSVPHLSAGPLPLTKAPGLRPLVASDRTRRE